MNQPIYVTEEQVLEILTWSVVNEAVEEAMIAATQKQRYPNDAAATYAIQPARTMTSAAEESQLLFTMPCFVGNYNLTKGSDKKSTAASSATGTKSSTLACKLVTSFPGNRERSPALPNIMAHIMLFSEETGELMCVMAATNITAWRTAAASIVATRYLFMKRTPAAVSEAGQGLKVAIIGCGAQGRAHAFGMSHSFELNEVYLWNRTASKAQALANDLDNELRKHSKTVTVHVSGTPAEAVADADIICVCTFASEALVNMDMIKKTNVHINAIGAGQVHFGEVSSDIYAKALIYIDSWDGARKELKDLPGEILEEVGKVILQRSYPPAGSITVFQSLGMASEDATVGRAVFEAFKNHS